MPDCRLTHAVTDRDGTLLLDAGTCLTRQVMDASVRGQAGAMATCRLLDYRQVRSDLLGFFADSPYDLIFQEAHRQEELLKIAGDVVLPEPVLESLYHFREWDFYTYRHTLLVFALSILIARELIDDRDALLQEVMAGPTHDIGKLCVPLEILTKETPLTQAQHAHLRHHAVAGYVLLSHYFRDPGILAAEVARDHHERRDGSGYPLGISIDNLMIDIIMISDVYDALISPRPYRPVSYDNRTALEELTRQADAGTISETVARVLVALNRRAQPHFSRCVVSTECRGTPPSKNVYGLIETKD
ncbi:HD-GYP domain-containing protein [Desulfosarcina sp.]|uniref:HD-GYP domain-containing protein n=1 Tax=Desulfosarcina sp. TaxID=2027861 RepID=UPI0029B0E368|nr:HD domain-containing phosphohydrolase [Desulfosarcina sp.]MDX2451031.1 HD domain-containing protein [Desulfosarcina sp.]MDX2488858.1 HD domain-containing protein [Desulfosarcina sp.]